MNESDPWQRPAGDLTRWTGLRTASVGVGFVSLVYKGQKNLPWLVIIR